MSAGVWRRLADPVLPDMRTATASVLNESSSSSIATPCEWSAQRSTRTISYGVVGVGGVLNLAFTA